MSRTHLASVVPVLFLTACAFPALPPLEGHPVGGDVIGLWTGAQLQLRLTGPAEGPEVLTLDQEGPFSFQDHLELGSGYSVEVAAQPEQHTCSVLRGSGVVQADVLDVQIRCISDIPIGATLSSPTPFTFDPQVTRQNVDVSILETEARFVVTAPADASIEIGGVTTPIGVLSAAVPLAFGQSEVSISISVGGMSRSYVVEFARGDVLPTEYARMIASNRDQSDAFGETIAVDGDRLVVGAIGEASSGVENDNSQTLAGAAYVFRRNGDTWVQEQYLKGQQIYANRLFGLALAIEGDTIAVGAHGAGIAGAVYVFGRVSSQWNQTIRLTAPSPSATDSFGFSVAMADPLLAVGDLGCHCVYVYRRNSNTWSYDTTVTGPLGGNFGFRVALAGNTLFVGAPVDASAAIGTMSAPATDTGSSGNGAVYVYRETSPANWVLEAYIKPSSPIATGNFGSSLSASGTALVVGSAGRDDLHFVEFVGGVWSQPVRIQASQQTQALGSAVALRRDVIAASEESVDKIHVFHRVGSTWLEADDVTRTSGNSGDRFGHSVVLTGSGLIGGAHRSESDQGAAHAVR